VRRRRLGVLLSLGLVLPATAHAATAQVVATGNLGADIAAADDGRVFLVTRAADVRVAPPGEVFGPPRRLMSSSRTERMVDAGVAADGRGVLVLQGADRRSRRVRVATFSVLGPVGRPVTVSTDRGRADFAAVDVARSGAAVVVWFRHRKDGRWRLESSIRDPGAAAFGAPVPISAFVRRACCTSVSVAIGEHGDAVATWTSTARPAVWAAARRPGHAFRRPQRLAGASIAAPKAVVGAGGAAAVTYMTQHAPLRASDGLQLHRLTTGGAFGVAEHVGVATVGAAALTAEGHLLVGWVDRDEGRVHVSEGRPAEPLVETGTLGTDVASRGLAVAADDEGRAVIAWSQPVSGAPAYREQAMAAIRQAGVPAIGPAVPLGRPWRAAQPVLATLVPGAGPIVLWSGSRYGRPATRLTALIVTRLP
jgi:hypothetical protein